MHWQTSRKGERGGGDGEGRRVGEGRTKVQRRKYKENSLQSILWVNGYCTCGPSVHKSSFVMKPSQ